MAGTPISSFLRELGEERKEKCFKLKLSYKQYQISSVTMVINNLYLLNAI